MSTTVYDRTELSASQSLLVSLVPAGARVLELGANTGYMSEALRERGCDVLPLEFDEAALAVLTKRFPNGGWCDLRDLASLEHLAEDRFDAIVLADVLEHLPEPEAVLAWAARHLAPGGRVFVSLPNVAYWRVRWDLARGRFERTDWGILDRTHLHFFTLESAQELFGRCSLRVDARHLSPGHPPVDRAGAAVYGILRRLPRAQRSLREGLLRVSPSAAAYQSLHVLAPA